MSLHNNADMPEFIDFVEDSTGDSNSSGDDVPKALPEEDVSPEITQLRRKCQEALELVDSVQVKFSEDFAASLNTNKELSTQNESLKRELAAKDAELEKLKGILESERREADKLKAGVELKTERIQQLELNAERTKSEHAKQLKTLHAEAQALITDLGNKLQDEQQKVRELTEFKDVSRQTAYILRDKVERLREQRNSHRDGEKALEKELREEKEKNARNEMTRESEQFRVW